MILPLALSAATITVGALLALGIREVKGLWIKLRMGGGILVDEGWRKASRFLGLCLVTCGVLCLLASPLLSDATWALTWLYTVLVSLILALVRAAWVSREGSKRRRKVTGPRIPVPSQDVSLSLLVVYTYMVTLVLVVAGLLSSAWPTLPTGFSESGEPASWTSSWGVYTRTLTLCAFTYMTALVLLLLFSRMPSEAGKGRFTLTRRAFLNFILAMDVAALITLLIRLLDAASYLTRGVCLVPPGMQQPLSMAILAVPPILLAASCLRLRPRPGDGEGYKPS